MHKEDERAVALLLHDLINQLSVIVGNCDLLLERTKDDPEYATRVAVIRETAEKAAKGLREHPIVMPLERGKERRKAAG